MVKEADPAITGIEVVGFLYWITSIVAYVIFILWAFTPESLLQGHGITYYPSKYWAIALPSWFCVTVIFVYWIYESLNMIHAVPENDRKPLQDSQNICDKKFFSNADDNGLLPLVELPTAVVKMVLEENVPPLEAEALFKQQEASKLTARRLGQEISIFNENKLR